MSKEAKVMTAILVAVVGGLIGVFALFNKPEPAAVGDATKIIRETSHKTGTGSVQLVEFGDFQCPSCAVAHPTVKQIMKDFDGKVTFYFRNFPLSQHQNAQISSQAAEAAGAQGKFWEMYDKLYENQKAWENEANPTDIYAGYAKEIGLDVDKFKADLSDKAYQSVIDQDVADGGALNVQGTPTFFVNGKLVSGFSYADLRDAINAALGTK